MYNKIMSVQLEGIDGNLYFVESDNNRSNGNVIIGNVNSIIRNSGSKIEKILNNYGINNINSTTNIAPADKRKVGNGYDLPILINLLASCRDDLLYNFIELNKEFNFGAFGEILENGSIKGVNGAFSLAECLKNAGCKICFMSFDDREKCKCLEDASFKCLSFYNVKSLVSFLTNISIENIRNLSDNLIDLDKKKNELSFSSKSYFNIPSELITWDAVYPEKLVKLVASSFFANSNVNFDYKNEIGVPNFLKFISLSLPTMSLSEQKEVYKVYDSVNNSNALSIDKYGDIIRNVRTPHYSNSLSTLLGGGINPQVGEVSLAHNGILYLDSVLLFNRIQLEELYKVISKNSLSIERLRNSIIFPAKNFVVSSINNEEYKIIKKYDRARVSTFSYLKINQSLNFDKLMNDNDKMVSYDEAKKIINDGYKIYKANKFNKNKYVMDRILLAYASLNGRDNVIMEDFKPVYEAFLACNPEKKILDGSIMSDFENTLNKAQDHFLNNMQEIDNEMNRDINEDNDAPEI